MLFDEVEKAHPDVFNILLQILDDGRITDSQGRTVDFKNTIIILTSNLGSSELLDGIQPDGSISESARAAVMGELRRAFRPEFLNRLDEIIMFKPLTKENLSGIIDILMEGLKKRLADKTLRLEVTDAAKSLIIERGFDPIYGARPLKRYLQSAAETLIAKEILRGDLAAGSTLVLRRENGKELELPQPTRVVKNAHLERFITRSLPIVAEYLVDFCAKNCYDSAIKAKEARSWTTNSARVSARFERSAGCHRRRWRRHSKSRGRP